MLKSVATKWVKALRSGEYSQSAGQLVAHQKPWSTSKKEVIGHCCLGVLCDVQKIPKELFAGHSYLENDLPTLAGIRTDMGGVVGPKGSYKRRIRFGNKSYLSLAAANDAGVSFERIANWIEKNYKLL